MRAYVCPRARHPVQPYFQFTPLQSYKLGLLMALHQTASLQACNLLRPHPAHMAATIAGTNFHLMVREHPQGGGRLACVHALCYCVPMHDASVGAHTPAHVLLRCVCVWGTTTHRPNPRSQEHMGCSPKPIDCAKVAKPPVYFMYLDCSKLNNQHGCCHPPLPPRFASWHSAQQNCAALAV